MSSLKSDLEQIAERLVHAEKRNEQGRRKTETDHILPPCEQLPHTELRRGLAPDRLHLRNLRPDEEGGKDDVDQESRQCAPAAVPLGSHLFPERVDPEQTDQTADHRSGQVEPLEERNRGADNFPQHQQQTQSAERHHDGFHAAPSLASQTRSYAPCVLSSCGDRTHFRGTVR